MCHVNECTQRLEDMYVLLSHSPPYVLLCDTVVLYSPGWSETCHTNQPVLHLTEILPMLFRQSLLLTLDIWVRLVSELQRAPCLCPTMLGLQVHTATACLVWFGFKT